MLYNYRKLLFVGMVSAGIFLIPACSSVQSPAYLPSGYAYQKGDNNVPPGPAPQDIGYGWSVQKNAVSAAHWRVAARDIVTRIITVHGLSDVPLHVTATGPRTPMTRTFDNFLREELIEAGFVLTSFPGRDSVLHYDVVVADRKSEQENGEEEKPPSGEALTPIPGEREVIITVSVTADGQIIAKETGAYQVPDAESYNYREPVLRGVPVVGKKR